MNLQPQIGSGMNAGWDASTNSFIVSNDAPAWIWLRIYARVNDDSASNLYYYYFEEVEWTGSGFEPKLGGVKLDQATQTKGPKAFPMPFIFDRRDSLHTLNDFRPQVGCIVPAQAIGTDPKDGREVYYFWSGTNPNNRYFVRIDQNQSGGATIVNTKYSASLCSTNPYNFPIIAAGGTSSVWAVEQNGSPLVPGRVYNGFSIGNWNPGDPRNANATGFNDDRPLVLCIKQGSSGPSSIRVVTGVTNSGGSLVLNYATFSQDEYLTVIAQQSGGFKLIDLLDTPKNYGAANQLLATNGNNGFYYINSANVGIQWPTPPQSGTGFLTITNQSGVSSIVPDVHSDPGSVVVTGNLVSMGGVGIKLENDLAGPGPNMYYGTDANGVKGWYPLP